MVASIHLDPHATQRQHARVLEQLGEQYLRFRRTALILGCDFNSDVSLQPQGLASSLSSGVFRAVDLRLTYPPSYTTHWHGGPQGVTQRELDYFLTAHLGPHHHPHGGRLLGTML